MKRKRGSAKRKPPMKPHVAAANVETANSAFLNAEDYSHWDGKDGSDSRMEAETAHTATTKSCHHTGLQEANILGEMDAGNSVPNTNLLKNVASFAAKLSRAVVTSSVEPTNTSLPFRGDKLHDGEPRESHSDLRYDEQELNDALLVIKKIMKMDAAKPFNLPVDPKALGIPDYFDVIDTPMDFGTICNNLEWGGKYRNSKDVYKDVQLIWDNCSKYNNKGDYILELMKRVKINFVKHWNAAGLCRQGQEVDYEMDLETNLHNGTESFKRQSKGGTSGSMISNSIHQEGQDFPGLYQVEQQQCSPCFSHTQAQHLPSQCQCEWQSLHPHCSGCGCLATSESTMGHDLHAHRCQGGPIGGVQNCKQQEEIRPQKELSHHPSPSCGSKCHLNERPYKQQSKSSHHHHLTKPLGASTESAGHFHSPYHGVSSSSTCKKCKHACSSVPMTCNVNNPKHYEMCSSHIHKHQSLLRYGDQNQPRLKYCDHHSNSSEMLNNEHDAGNALEGVNLHVHSPLESTVRPTKGRVAYPSASATDHSNHHEQGQNGSSQVPPSSLLHSHSYQLHGNSSQCQFNAGLPEPHLPQDRANIGGAEHSHVPISAESTVRHAKCQHVCSGTPVTDDCNDQGECQMGPRKLQSPSLGQSDQLRENDLQNQPISSPLEPSTPQDRPSLVRKTRGRGPTRCLKLLDEGKRISITTNELGQPVGVNAPKLISFLGILARNGHMAPLTFVDWRAMPEEKKQNMWQEVQAWFEIDPKSKTWVIKSLSKKWKDWKSKLKTAHYITHTTDEERLADRDERVLPDQWAYLVSHWSSELGEKRSARNKANRAKQKFGHITGTKSFARIREEQRVKRPDGKAPSKAELFILTRTRKDGKPVNEASSAVITQLREVTNQPNATSHNGTAEDDVFSQIIGRDTRGRIRCYGLGPSPSEFGEANPAKAEATKMVSEANSEVIQMKERLMAMEQTCAQMAQQMAAMMSMMSSMQKNSGDGNLPPPVHNGSGTSEGLP